MSFGSIYFTISVILFISYWISFPIFCKKDCEELILDLKYNKEEGFADLIGMVLLSAIASALWILILFGFSVYALYNYIFVPIFIKVMEFLMRIEISNNLTNKNE